MYCIFQMMSVLFCVCNISEALQELWKKGYSLTERVIAMKKDLFVNWTWHIVITYFKNLWRKGIQFKNRNVIPAIGWDPDNKNNIVVEIATSHHRYYYYYHNE